MKKAILFFAAATIFSLHISAQQKKAKTAGSVPAENSGLDKLWTWKKERQEGTKEAVFYNITLNAQMMASIWEKEPEELQVSVPVKTGSIRSFRFRKSNILSEDFVVSTPDGRKLSGKEYTGLHYQIVEESDCKIGGISFREGSLIAFIGVSGSAISIGEKEPGSGKLYLSFDADQKMPEWSCGSEMFKQPDTRPLGIPPATDKSITPICKTVRIYMEGDFDLYTKSGNSVSTASNFITGLFNVVAQVYAKEGITIQLAQIFQWTSADPYVSMNSSSTILSSYVTGRPASTVNANLIHLLSTRSIYIGGIAYMGVLCNPFYKHGYSNISYQYAALPAYSWSVFCISHELGHNFGSNHTQWCGWTLPNGTTGRIDSCAAGEGSCGSTIKYRQGTIMSYCHTGFMGIDMNQGFGPLPRAAIRDGLNNATCITSGSSCLGTPTVRADSLTNRNNSYLLTLNIPSGHNATSWTLLEGSTSIRTGTLSGSTAFTTTVSITGKPNGTYTYTLRIANGSSTSTSSAINVTVALPATQPPTSSGVCTANGLMAWFGTDGKMRFRFSISSPCTTYRVQVCRYNLTNPAVVPAAGASPVACGIRNGMSAYAPTAAEWSQGFIERIADPQPSNLTTPGMGSFWYSVDVTCNSGASCTTTNRTRTYIFVPGI